MDLHEPLLEREPSKFHWRTRVGCCIVITALCGASVARHAMATFSSTVSIKADECLHEIWVIRHGEKSPNAKPGSPEVLELNITGWARAEHLAALVRDALWPTFTAVFASSPLLGKRVLRELQTVEAAAGLLGLQVNTEFAAADIDGIASAALATSRASCGIVLVCWDHCRIPTLLVELGCTSPQCAACWPDGTYDRIDRLDVSGDQVRWLEPRAEGFRPDIETVDSANFECLTPDTERPGPRAICEANGSCKCGM